jgi:serine/threonine-protein kinase
MGSVWEASHLTLGKRVAVKFLHPSLLKSDEALRRFDTEARAAARIKSRHAVEVHDHGVENGVPFIVMEYLRGESLEAAIARRGPLPLKQTVEIVHQAALALEAAHAAGVIHRDLKPDNIFLCQEAERPTSIAVKVVDFGIAKLVTDTTGSGATQAGTVLGTPHYMSPEALTGSTPVSTGSDVWSLGACAFAAACRRIPFPGDAIGQVVMKVCSAPLPVPSRVEPGLPPAFDAWFARACARRPEERFQSMRELASAIADLERWAPSAPESSGPASDWTMPPPQFGGQARAMILAGALAGAAVTLGVAGYVVLQQKRAAQETVNRAAASAAAVIEADNQRKLAEAERAFRDRTRAKAPERPDAGATLPRPETGRR